MDSQAYIEFLRRPFQERLDMQYAFYQQELEKGYMIGRTGVAPVDTVMQYKDLTGDDFRDMLIFGSNSYLNLSTHPYVVEAVIEAVRKYGVGTGGSPAFSGYTRQHRELELRLAALAGHEDALLLPSGYVANLCWVNGLLTRNDILLYDKYSHASVLNAIKMTGVQFFSYDPDDLAGLQALVGQIKARRGADVQLFATVEGVRSIDGSVIDLSKYFQICKQHGIFVILDDAHGLGVLGKTGKGTLEYLDLMGEADLRMSTCSKALGAQGAFVSGSAKSIFYLRSHAKPYVFTTALSQPTVAAINAALDILEREPAPLRALHQNREYMQDRLEQCGFHIYRGQAGIIPLFLPDGKAGPFNKALHRRGVFANVMEYPMVAPGMERLRLSLMADHTRQQIDSAADRICRVAEELGIDLLLPDHDPSEV